MLNCKQFHRAGPLFVRLLRLLGIVTGLMVLGWTASGHTADRSEIHLTGAERSLPVGHFFDQLEDRERRADLLQICARPSGWIPVRGDSLSFGLSRSAWWVRTRLVNDSTNRVDEVLDLGSAAQDYAQFFLVGLDGTVLVDRLRGDRVPAPSQGLPSRTITLPIALPPHGAVDLFVRFDTYDGLYELMPLRLSERQAFSRTEDDLQLMINLYHGSLLGLLLFNIFMCVSTRQASFGYYVFYLFAFLTNSVCFRGFDLEYLWPQWPRIHNILTSLSISVSFAAVGMFVISYVRLCQNGPNWLYRSLRVLILLDLVAAALAAADYYALAIMCATLLGLTQMLLYTFGAIALSVRGVRPAYFLMTAFAPLQVAVLGYFLDVSGAIDTGGWSFVGLQAGSGFEMLVLACGLADALNVLKAQKLIAERAALKAQLTLTVELEGQVAERTQALSAANIQLQRLSLTDELTGAFNRRHFNNTLSELIRSGGEQARPIGLCIFDIDHFKRFNDTYGHPDGDAALQAVAKSVQNALRDPDDCLFRIGGEEFAVIMDAKSADATKDCAERLRLAVESLVIPHKFNTPPIVTASFGLAWWGGHPVDHDIAERLFSTADRMLYLAKETGRNKVLDAVLDE